MSDNPDNNINLKNHTNNNINKNNINREEEINIIQENIKEETDNSESQIFNIICQLKTVINK